MLGLLAPALAFAEPPTPYDDLEVVSLFEMACVDFAGNPAGLRKMPAAFGIAPVADAQARTALDGQAGKVFEFDSPTQTRRVLSFDNGSCSVLADAADPARVEHILRVKLAGHVFDGRRWRFAVEPVLHGAGVKLTAEAVSASP
jgi:hypothetical protein